MDLRPPKLFVSYSWSSDEHMDWVMTLAKQLRDNGVDVILDKWDLPKGADKHQFMERMVVDPKVKKVVMICDAKYAEKANDRVGGVGEETQIITAEIYAQKDQSKFVAVVVEYYQDGKPCVPAYYKSRIHIDMSRDDLYDENFEELLRWVFDKPLYLKPAIGKMPAFLTQDATPSLGTTFQFKRALEGIKNSRPYRTGAVNEYFDKLAASFGILRLVPTSDTIDQQVINSINDFLPYRNEAIQVFLTLAQYGPSAAEQRLVHRFFEKTVPFMVPQKSGLFCDKEFYNFRFIVHELFLYAVASMLKHESFECASHLMHQPYYFPGLITGRLRDSSFTAMYMGMMPLIYRKDGASASQQVSRDELLTSRATESGVRFEDLVQADFTLLVTDLLAVLRGYRSIQHWMPETMMLRDNGEQPLEIYARSRSKSYFEKLKCLFQIEQKDDLEPLMQAIGEGKIKVPYWSSGVDVAALLNFAQLASIP